VTLPDYSFEEMLWIRGKLLAGVDEAGRGPLAGPVVAAAVIFPQGCKLDGINDSKKLSPKKRERLFYEIKKSALATAITIIKADIIDQINILRASLLAMEEAIKKLDTQPDYILIDGEYTIPTRIQQGTLVKGDSKCCSIAAASILAKVARDAIMDDYHSQYPQYNFRQHKGYPTKDHLEAIRKFGPSPIHRKTFKGVLKVWT
jgi:ribonuclease HII